MLSMHRLGLSIYCKRENHYVILPGNEFTKTLFWMGTMKEMYMIIILWMQDINYDLMLQLFFTSILFITKLSAVQTVTFLPV